MEFSFFSGLGCPKFFPLPPNGVYRFKRGSRQRMEKGPLCAACRDVYLCMWPAGLLGHPSRWCVPGGCCDPRDVTAWASPHLERRCHFGLKWFKHFNKFGVTQVVEFFVALFSPKSSSAPAAGSALTVLLVVRGAEGLVEDLGLSEVLLGVSSVQAPSALPSHRAGYRGLVECGSGMLEG